MSQATDQPKPFPYACTKQNLVRMYVNQMREADILRGINEIIRENRKIPIEKPVYVQRIWHRELSEFVETYGVAKGFNLPNDWK